ncbi:Cell division cycle protein 123-like [Hondaea fermentalgiana]|uniref:Cell division cycle protein 123-like n=1 Tax=Hondaea fermentalgiana TaxID=2315210 RepID=A0A2R5GHT2_9STRA|nr:Cell division cycle protein 123-like [Hondaea fermentalgiana]|eukprot:GBG30442.1 Cell division cycle protein 123-like [Hondaea fermentalgiana]
MEGAEAKASPLSAPAGANVACNETMEKTARQGDENQQQAAQQGWVLRLDRADVDRAAFDAWYPIFSRRKGDKTSKQHTIRSLILPIDDDFLAYLNQDGVVLPTVPEGMDLAVADPRYVVPAPEDTYDNFGDVDWETDSSADELDDAQAPCFQALEASLRDALDELKGEAFVKLRWTSPQDASWVCGSLRCSTPGHVFLLLKSSDFIRHDLDHVYDNCWDANDANDANGVKTDTNANADAKAADANADTAADGVQSGQSAAGNLRLVLRRWSHLNRAMEFRCFIYGHELIAIAQRHPHDFYAYLQEGEPFRAKVLDAITSFFDSAQVPDLYPAPNFVMDVYVDREERVWIVDFGPLATFVPEAEISSSSPNVDSIMRCSQSLVSVPPHELLSWQDLRRLISVAERQQETSAETDEHAEANDTDQFPEFRVVTSRREAESSRDVKRSHCVPIELVNGQLTPDIVKQAQDQLEAMSTKSKTSPPEAPKE